MRNDIYVKMFPDGTELQKQIETQTLVIIYY